MRALIVIAIAASSGCLRNTVFHCMTTEDCALSGTDGVCEGDGFCSIADRNCVSGRAYNEYSGDLSHRCVAMPDGGVDAESRCAPSFEQLLGAPGHLYYVFTTPSDYPTQQSACQVQGLSTYLAIPDSPSELRALLDVGAQPQLWVGINDAVTEGVFLTVVGAVPAYLPWNPGQPDDAPPGEDCVAGIAANAAIQDDSCDLMRIAICECEP